MTDMGGKWYLSGAKGTNEFSTVLETTFPKAVECGWG
jgi:hypothetical protein